MFDNTIRSFFFVAALISCFFSMSAYPGKQPEAEMTAIAETVYRNGYIYTVDTFNSVAEAVAIRDGQFIAVGSNDEISAHIGPGTEVMDLRGKMVMPGIIDMHVHPLRGALAKFNFCSFSADSSLEQILQMIRGCVADKKPGEWVQGSKWDSTLAGSLDKSILDKIAPNNPVYLNDDTNHLAWVNSKALEMAGITAATPDPDNGVIVRDPATGEPTGILEESASGLVLNALPPPSPAMLKKSAKWIFKKLNAYGVTTLQAAQLDARRLAAYRDLEANDELTIRMKANWDYNTRYADAPRDEMLERFDSREKRGPRTDLINPDGAKIYVDGVWVGFASPYLAPYEGTHKHGRANIDLPSLSTAVTELDKLGLSVMMHAVGDIAVRNAMDAVAAARRTNGSDGPRHILAHTYSVHPDDKGRGRDLNIAFEISPPDLWFPSNLSRAAVPLIGRDRARAAIPARSMLAAGDVICYGSDWDNIPQPDPWLALEGLVTRQRPGAPQAGFMGRDEALDLPTALEVLTYNGAWALGLEGQTGSIEAGKSADMIVLNQNLFEVPPADIHRTRVKTTLLRGRTVFSQ